MNWKAILEGALSAAAGGAFTYGAQALGTGNFDWVQTKHAIIGGAMVGLAAYFKTPATATPKPTPKPLNDAEPPPDPGPQG